MSENVLRIGILTGMALILIISWVLINREKVKP
jgi:hypothetical protein